MADRRIFYADQPLLDLPRPPDPAVSMQHLTRFFYFEAQVVNWVLISIAMATVGTLVHLNLNFIVGSCMMLIAVLNLFFTMYGYYIWVSNGDPQVETILAERTTLLKFKFFSLFVWIVFCVWAAALMIIRSE